MRRDIRVPRGQGQTPLPGRLKAMRFRDLHSIRRSRILVPFALLSLIPILAGCGGHGTTAPAKLVPLTLAGGGTGVRSVSAIRAGSFALADTDTVAFTRALLVVRDIRFKTSDVP